MCSEACPPDSFSSPDGLNVDGNHAEGSSPVKADMVFLEEAVRLGRKGWGGVNPNPLVGCVLVRDGAVVGRGWHRRVGGPHAEVWALEQAGDLAHASTAYVSLEPCDHHGRTPPCTEALQAAGVSRVVYGAADPGAESGGGGNALREGGMTVEGPAFDLDRCRAENPAFFHWAERGAPFVAIKLAQTLDGKISRRGAATRITGPESERHVHHLRRGFDAVLIGAGTATIDDPRLTVRHGPAPDPPPARVVLDSNARLTPAARLLQGPLKAPVHVFVAPGAEQTRVNALADAGARVHPVRTSGTGLDLHAVMEQLGGLGYRSVLCEGGSALTRSLLDAELVERLYLYVAPWVLGPGGLEGLVAPVGQDRWSAWRSLDIAVAAPFADPHGGPGGVGLGSDGLLVYRRTY